MKFDDIDNKSETTLYEKMITEQLEEEISNTIYDLVQPKIDNMVKELAAEAVKSWSTQMYMSKEPGYDMKTNIQIEFVENIIRTETKVNPISIEVIKK